MAYLSISNLKKKYRISRTEYQEVLKGIDVEFKRGEMVAILGESGCGKSTFMNILGGLDNDYTGSIVLGDSFMKDFSEKDLDNYRKRKVGLIFQSYNLISHMTVKQNIEIAMTMCDESKEFRRETTDNLLKLVGLEDMGDKLPNQLSGGQRQRVAIARALSNLPEIVLADEPTGALDKESAEQVLNILKSIAEMGKLVIIVTHSQKVANECNRILTIDDGVIVSDEKIKDRPVRLPPLEHHKPRNVRFGELFKLAFSNVLQTRKRSFLVSIGMAIGIAAVIIVFCLSLGLISYVNNSMADSMNALLLQVTSESAISNDAIKTVSDMEGVDYLVEGSYIRLNSTYRFDKDTGYIMMINSSFDRLERSLIAGEMCADGEILISGAFAENLYNNSIETADELVGQTIAITFSGVEKEFVISGVYEDSSDYSDYACCYLSKSSLEQLYNSAYKTFKINLLYVYITDTSYLSAVIENIETFGFSVARDDSTIETVLGYIDIGTSVLIGVSLISIAVSAIMIFIVTYVSVIERTKEIGILRAVGGRKKDITILFIIESGIIGAIAGIVAVVFSLFISIVANLIIATSLSYWIISLNPLVYAVCFVLSILIGIGSGFVPSMQAANLDPVESLRCE